MSKKSEVEPVESDTHGVAVSRKGVLCEEVRGTGMAFQKKKINKKKSVLSLTFTVDYSIFVSFCIIDLLEYIITNTTNSTYLLTLRCYHISFISIHLNHDFYQLLVIT